MPARPDAVAQREEACDPTVGGAMPEVPLVTYASPIGDEPGVGPVGSGFGGGSPIAAAVGIGSLGGGGPTTPPVAVEPVAGPIPEPSVWLMMIVGVGVLGAGLRYGRRTVSVGGRSRGMAGRGFAGGALWSGSAAVEAGDLAATVAVKSAMASAAGKALLCVCPAVVVAGSVLSVPPLRQAVHAATIPAEALAPAVAAPVRILQPCPEAMTVPVASSAIEGLPATVQTVPAAVPAATATLVEAVVAPAAT